MSETFITNAENQTLLARLAELSAHSDHLSFLSGFFYFSGNQVMAESLKRNSSVKLRILVGLEADPVNGAIAEFSRRRIYGSRKEELSRYLKALSSSLQTQAFDEPDFHKQAHFFLDLMDKGRLEIRKTREPNHAKLYLFELNESQIGKNKLFITGSSNLTRFGLVAQREFNVEISDYGFEKAKAYFEDCWQTAVPLTESKIEREEIRRTLISSSPLREISPVEAYLAAIDAYLDSIGYFDEVSVGIDSIIQRAGYKPFKYQIDAVSQALSIFNKFGGVVIADVVGLGKSVIGSALVSAIGKRGILIAPPGLLGDEKRDSGWRKYLEDFGLHDWLTMSSGSLDTADELVARLADVEVVMIDEAHRFRNENTKSYETLLKICRDKKVVLLTATPFNNSPSDLLSLLKLFTDPKNSGLSLDRNVKAKFDGYKSEFEKLSFIKKNHNSKDPFKRSKAQKFIDGIFDEQLEDLSQIDKRSEQLGLRIKAAMAPVLIRRNRLDILKNPDYADQVAEFPVVGDPQEWFFELTKDQSAFYDSVIQKIFADPSDGGVFEGAVYQPQRFQKKDGESESPDSFEQIQQNLYDFMRRLLVKRFESSFGAFRESLINFKKTFESALNFVESNRIFLINRDLMSKLDDADAEESQIELDHYLESLAEASPDSNEMVYDFSDDEIRGRFVDAIERDIKTFSNLLHRIDELGMVQQDPKAKALISQLQELRDKDPKRKIVIFSEYRDTVEYFRAAIEESFPDEVLSVTGELSGSTLRKIQTNFDATFADAGEYSILIGTDKLSEGFNLNRAGIVVNLDIPWNPVRVIQRLGRINRIGAMLFKEIHLVNFFPTELGAALVKSREIASDKMFLIHSALGEDSKVFDSNETPGPSGLYRKLNANPDEFEQESLLTRLLSIRRSLMNELGLDFEKKIKMPNRVKSAKFAQHSDLSVLVRGEALHSAQLRYDAHGRQEIVEVHFEELLQSIESDSSSRAAPWNTEWFWSSYKAVLDSLDKVPLSPQRGTQSNENKALQNIERLLQQGNETDSSKADLRALREEIVGSGKVSIFTLRQLATAETSEVLLKRADEAGLLSRVESVFDFTEPEIVLALGNVVHDAE